MPKRTVKGTAKRATKAGGRKGMKKHPSEEEREAEALLRLLEGIAPAPEERAAEPGAVFEEEPEEKPEEGPEEAAAPEIGFGAEVRGGIGLEEEKAVKVKRKGIEEAPEKKAIERKEPKVGERKERKAVAIPAPRPLAAIPAAAGLPGVERAAVELREIPRTPSGVPGLDEMLDGGLEERSIVLVNGDPGSGKTIFGLQFLHESLRKDEAVLYISFGEPRELLYPRMLPFGMDLQGYESRRLFFMIQYQPHEVAKLMAEEGGTIHDIVTAYKVKRIVIDPITPYLAQYVNVYDARLSLVRMFNVIRKWGATTLLLNEVSPEVAKSPASLIAEFHADGVINLIHERTGDGVQVRGVEIWKMCGINHAQIARPFTFTKKGIVVYPNERLFAAQALRR